MQKRLAKVISMVGLITYVPHDEDTYTFLIYEIIEQMLSVKVDQKIYGCLEELCEGEVTPERIMTLSNEEIRSIGNSVSKVKCIRCVTDAALCGDLSFEDMHKLSDSEVMQSLTKIHDIGNWTAKMFLMFVLDRPDALPVEDGAFLQTCCWVNKTDDSDEKTVYQKCKKWKLYSSIELVFSIEHWMLE